jgi:hypothetical protein
VLRYITYAKEEEAIRCIQAVHNFVLEGKVLRLAFLYCFFTNSSFAVLYKYSYFNVFIVAEHALVLQNIVMHGYGTWYN